MHCASPRQSLSALITTPIQVGQPMQSCLIALTADTLRYGVTLTFDPLTLDICSLYAVH